MADSEDFAAVVRVIERTGSLNEMQSRGLVRRLLTQAGLGSRDVSAFQLAVVGRTLLRSALEKNGISDAAPVVAEWMECCAKQGERAKTADRGKVSNTVEAVFARMGLRR